MANPIDDLHLRLAQAYTRIEEAKANQRAKWDACMDAYEACADAMLECSAAQQAARVLIAEISGLNKIEQESERRDAAIDALENARMLNQLYLSQANRLHRRKEAAFAAVDAEIGEIPKGEARKTLTKEG